MRHEDLKHKPLHRIKALKQENKQTMKLGKQ